MNYVALKPVNFGGRQYKAGEIIPEGVVDERRSLFLKKSGHIAEAAIVNEANTENLSVNPNTLSIPLLQSKHELAVNAQQLLQFFATIQETINAIILARPITVLPILAPPILALRTPALPILVPPIIPAGIALALPVLRS